MKADSAIFAPETSTTGHGAGGAARLRDLALAGPVGVGGFAWEPGEREGLWDALLARHAAPGPARPVTLVILGDRRIGAAAFGPYTACEQELVDQLAGALAPGALNLADRNFSSMRRFLAFAATGAHLLWRVKNASHLISGRTTSRLLERADPLPRHPRPRAGVDLPVPVRRTPVGRGRAGCCRARGGR